MTVAIFAADADSHIMNWHAVNWQRVNRNVRCVSSAYREGS